MDIAEKRIKQRVFFNTRIRQVVEFKIYKLTSQNLTSLVIIKWMTAFYVFLKYNTEIYVLLSYFFVGICRISLKENDRFVFKGFRHIKPVAQKTYREW